MKNRTADLTSRATRLVNAQSTESLLSSLAALEVGAPEPTEPGMREWSLTVEWIEEELLDRLDCRDAHTDWVLSDEFGNYTDRTSYEFFAKVSK